MGEQVSLFVDDAVVIVIGKDFIETHEKLWNIMNWARGIFQWAKDHNCEFGIEKFQLLDITQRLTPHPLNPKMGLNTRKPVYTLKRNGKIPGHHSGQQIKLERAMCSSNCKGTRLANSIWMARSIILRDQCKVYMATIPLHCSTPNVICSWHFSHTTTECREGDERRTHKASHSNQASISTEARSAHDHRGNENYRNRCHGDESQTIVDA